MSFFWGSVMKFFNIFGLIFVFIIMIPNIVFAVKCKDGFENKQINKAVEIAEQIGRFGCFGFMIFNLPLSVQGWLSSDLVVIYLVVNSLLTIAYCLIWLICFKKNTMFRALALSIVPSIMFLFSGIIMQSVPLTVSALIFMPCHIYISYVNAK